MAINYLAHPIFASLHPDDIRTRANELLVQAFFLRLARTGKLTTPNGEVFTLSDDAETLIPEDAMHASIGHYLATHKAPLLASLPPETAHAP